MKKIHLYDTIISPVVTEKSTNLSEQNKIVFKVSNKLNKIILKKNIEKIFKVNVIKVNIINKQSRKKITRGKKVKIQFRGKLDQSVKAILGGVRSSCTYVGAPSLKQLSKCTTFVRVNQQYNDTFGRV